PVHERVEQFHCAFVTLVATIVTKIEFAVHALAVAQTNSDERQNLHLDVPEFGEHVVEHGRGHAPLAAVAWCRRHRTFLPSACTAWKAVRKEKCRSLVARSKELLPFPEVLPKTSVSCAAQ